MPHPAQGTPLKIDLDQLPADLAGRALRPLIQINFGPLARVYL
jgi:hypothetical protein